MSRRRVVASLAFLLTLGVLPVGCARQRIIMEAPDGPETWWRTESRMQWYWTMIPVGPPHPVDVYYSTQAACEAFRAAHPTFTRADEPCQVVRGRSFTIIRPVNPHNGYR